jgi:hypothetical protein
MAQLFDLALKFRDGLFEVEEVVHGRLSSMTPPPKATAKAATV